MDIGDWLYIIIIVIAGISSIFSSSKKKKKPTQVLGQPGSDDAFPEEENPEEEKGFWELFKELQEEQEVPQPQPVERPVVEPVLPPVQTKVSQPKVKQTYRQTQAVPTPKKTTSPFLQGELASSRSKSRTTVPLQLEQDDNYIFGDEDFHDVQELRKAIIYTEILNRRY